MLNGLRFKLKQMIWNEDNNVRLYDAKAAKMVVGSQPIALENERFKNLIYDIIRNIKDPEKPSTLEDLNVVYEDGIEVTRNFDDSVYKVTIEFTPTVPQCSLASLIGLCIAVKLQRSIPTQMKYKLKITLKEGTHNTEAEIVKQINDKERVAAAMEVGGLRELVEKCISEDD